MGRLIRVVLYACVVLILYFWVTSLLKSYQQNKEVEKSLPEVLSDTSALYADTLPYDTTETGITENDIQSGDQVYDKLDKALEELDGKSIKNKEETIQQEPKKQDKPEKNTTKVSESVFQSNGNYMVIAGSFIKKENAQVQLKKLKNIGYSNAELKVFVASEYHSVIVSRYNSQSEAEKTVQDLKKKGIESFVKTKQ
ncbi:MAG: SPOR domain-containing protein [Saprospiraceae bacterium]|nr:SPOR domain-containing protein [Saprospiraceae bacterium]MBK7523917.1 SPOR domain-containing protein [Saprospiraceae bacterium]